MKNWDEVKEAIEKVFADNGLNYTKPQFCNYYIPEKDISIHLAGTAKKVEILVNAKTLGMRGFKSYISKI